MPHDLHTFIIFFLLVLDLTLLLEQSALRFFASCAAATVVVAAQRDRQTDRERERDREKQIGTVVYMTVRHDKRGRSRDIFSLATIRLYKRSSTFVELPILVEELSNVGLPDTLKKYYSEPVEHEAKSIVAGPTFIQFLNKLFRTQIAAGDILQFESDSQDKYFMFSLTGTWDEIIKLQ